jgi:hypothetical protein
MGFRSFKKRILMCRSIDVQKREDIMMIDNFIIADIAGRMQRTSLLQRTRRDRIKEEDAFYNNAGSSFLVRFAAWLTLPADEAAGRTKVRPDEDEFGCQAACLTRP